MTGCPIDTEAMRKQWAFMFDDGSVDVWRMTHNYAVRDIVALCDALDATRAEIERLRKDGRCDSVGPSAERCTLPRGHELHHFSDDVMDENNNCHSESWLALGEEKQR